MTFADLDEARRYVEMKRAGAVTSFDDTSPIDLIDGLLEVADAALRDTVSSEEHDKAVETTREEAESGTREELLGDAESLAAEVGVPFLMEALKCAIDRERREALVTLAAECTAARDSIAEERDELRKQVRALTSARKRARKGANTTGAGREGTP